MAVSELLRLVVEADTKGAVKGVTQLGKTADAELGKAEKRIDKVGAGFKKAGAVMLTAGGVMAAGMLKTVDAASNLEQAVGGTEAVFGDVSAKIDEFAKDSATAMGLSEREFREATTSIGGQLKRMTGDVDLAAEQSVQLTQVAADLAATYGGTTKEAVDALGAAFRGEADPAERFNLNLKAGAVSAKAVELGLAASTSEVSEAAKAQATLALIMEQSSDAQGQFARESDTVAGRMQVAKAEFENAQAALGTALAPAMADAAGLAASLAGGFSDLNEETGGLPAKLALGATGFLLIGGAISSGVGYAIQFRDKLKELPPTLGKVAGAATGIAALAAAYMLAKDSAESFADSASKAAGLADDELVEAFKGVSAASDDLGFVDAGEDLDLFRAIAENNIGTATRLRDELAGEGEDVAALDAILGEAATAQQQLSSDTDTSGEAVERFGEKTKGATYEAGEFTTKSWSLVDAIEGVDNALRAQMDPLFAAQDATQKLAEAQDAAAWEEAEHGKKSDEAVAAREEAARAALDYESSLLNLEAAIKSGEVSVSDAKDTLYRWAEQGYITKQAADEQAWSFGVLGGTAEGLPGDVSMSVHAPGLQTVLGRLARTQELLDHLDGRTANVHVSAAGFGVTRRAEGGHTPPGLTLVGEEGPELVNMARPSMVYTAGQTEKILNNSNTTQTNVFNIYNPTPETASESIYRAGRKAAAELSA